MDRPYLIDTASGALLDLADPDPAAICLEDIAGALSKICRFGAQTSRFYSVAQHAVLVQRLVTEDAGPNFHSRRSITTPTRPTPATSPPH